MDDAAEGENVLESAWPWIEEGVDVAMASKQAAVGQSDSQKMNMKPFGATPKEMEWSTPVGDK